ncbi:hypothetical protein J6590_077643 [Homalodisca vitripennis]|nr:hypothetical protein J6590_077643 [Homalodisca vitripennis]
MAEVEDIVLAAACCVILHDLWMGRKTQQYKFVAVDLFLMSQTNVKFAITTRSRSRLGANTEPREIKVDEAFSVIEKDRDLGECAQELNLESLSCSSSSSSISSSAGRFE